MASNSITLADVRDWLKGFDVADNYYIGKLDSKKDKSLGVYGDNPEKFLKLEGRDVASCDGKYLYVDNYFSLVLQSEENNKEQSRFIKVYDSDLNKTDEFSLGNGSAKTWCLLPVDDEYFIIAGKNDKGDLIFYYDKNEFGTLNGKEWKKKFSLK